MKRFTFSFSFLLLIAANLLSQNKIEWGTSKDAGNETLPLNFIGENSENYFIYSIDKLHSSHSYIEKYNKNSLSLINIIALSDDEIPGVIVKDQLTNIKQTITTDKIVFSYSIYNSGTSNWEERKDLFEATTNPVSTEYSKKKTTNRFYHLFSEDRKHLLFYRQDKEKKAIEYFVVDSELHVTKAYYMYENDAPLSIHSIYFNRSEPVFLCTQPRPSKEETQDFLGTNNFYYSLIIPKRGANTIIPIKLNVKKEHYVVEIKLTTDQNQNPVVFGCYKNKDLCCSRLSGMFYSYFDGNSGSLISSYEKDFTNEFSAHFISEREIKKGVGIFGLQPHEAFLKKDGTLLLLFENAWKVQSGNAWHFKANDIIPVSFNKVGEIEWTAFIPKKQQGSMWTNGMYISYIPVFSKESVSFLFNDNPINVDVLTKENLKSGFEGLEGSVTTSVTLDYSSGKWEKKLYDENKGSFYITPPFIFRPNNSEIIIHAQNDKSVVLGRLKY
jgi:hypothetical protein